MARVEVRRELDAEVRLAVHGLISDVEAATGARPLSDHLWLDLIDGGEDLLAVLLWDGSRLDGYAQVSPTSDGRALEVVTRQDVDRSELVRTALRAVADVGGGEVHWWVFDADDASAAIAADAGLRSSRTLYQMRVPLPLRDASSHTVATRGFVRGVDEDAWLEVNNAAFAGHPEQGGWDRETLRQRETQPWFDPEGFRLHEIDGRLAAFCWTKVHHDTDPVLGEIYVIAVHPDFHGRGLGKALTVAGLDHLAARGITTGMLYVDADNTAAVALYRGLGFTVHRTDRAFVRDVPATTGAAPQ